MGGVILSTYFANQIAHGSRRIRVIALHRGTKDHIVIKILHAGSKVLRPKTREFQKRWSVGSSCLCCTMFYLFIVNYNLQYYMSPTVRNSPMSHEGFPEARVEVTVQARLINHKAASQNQNNGPEQGPHKKSFRP